jgi:hypothetical protein
MNRIRRLMARASRLARQAVPLALACYLWLMTSELAWAWAKAQKKAVEEVETKSYVGPYLIVMVLVAMGLMAVCRPSRRLDKLDERIKEDKKEDE